MLFAELLRALRLGTRSGRQGGRRWQGRKIGWRLLRVESLEDRTLLDAVRWLGGSGNWSDATKWSGHVPGAGDTAIIDATGTNYTVTLDVNATVAGFTLNSANATFSASGRTFTVNGPAMLSTGTVLWVNSNGTGTGTLTNAASMIFQGGSAIANSFVQSGSVLIQGQTSSSAMLTAASGFTNAGTITLDSTGGNARGASLTVTSGTLTNAASGVINAHFEYNDNGYRSITGNLTNNGTVSTSTSLYLAGVVTNTAAFNISAGAFLAMSGTGQAFNQNGGTLANAGSVSLSGGAVFTQAGGAINNTGTFTLSAGAFNFSGGSATGMRLTLESAALTIGSASTMTGTVVLHGYCTLSGGVHAGQTMAIQAVSVQDAYLTAASGFTNAGTITLDSTGGYSAYVTVTSGTLTNAAGGTISVNPDGSGNRTVRAITAQLDNRGTLSVNADLTIVKAGAAHQNSGTMHGQRR